MQGAKNKLERIERAFKGNRKNMLEAEDRIRSVCYKTSKESVKSALEKFKNGEFSEDDAISHALWYDTLKLFGWISANHPDYPKKEEVRDSEDSEVEESLIEFIAWYYRNSSILQTKANTKFDFNNESMRKFVQYDYLHPNIKIDRLIARGLVYVRKGFEEETFSQALDAIGEIIKDPQRLESVLNGKED